MEDKEAIQRVIEMLKVLVEEVDTYPKFTPVSVRPEPKFKVGDWVVGNDYSFSGEVLTVASIGDYCESTKEYLYPCRRKDGGGIWNHWEHELQLAPQWKDVTEECVPKFNKKGWLAMEHRGYPILILGRTCEIGTWAGTHGYKLEFEPCGGIVDNFRIMRRVE